MAALLKFAPAHGALTAAETVARLNSSVLETSLSQQTGRRPALICRWLHDAEGRLCRRWEIEVPTDISASPAERVRGRPGLDCPALVSITPGAGEQV